jgi:hypothetical protein
MWMRCKFLSQCCRLGISGVILRILVLSCITFFFCMTQMKPSFCCRTLVLRSHPNLLLGSFELQMIPVVLQVPEILL